MYTQAGVAHTMWMVLESVCDSDNVISTKRSQGHFLHDKFMRRSGEHNRLYV